jgi:hypothetical protein
MAIDTEEKRYASLTFGHCLNAGTRIPSGTSTAARRGAALGLYVIESDEVPWTPIYTRIGVLNGASKRIGYLKGASKQIGSLNGASKRIGTLEGTDPQ